MENLFPVDRPIRADVVLQVVSNRGKIKKLRGLLDTGCTKSIFLSDYLEKDNMTKLKDPIKYGTYGSSFTARKEARVAFRLPEFDLHRKVFYKVTVDEKNKPCDSLCNCIIGTDIMEAIEIDILFLESKI